MEKETTKDLSKELSIREGITTIVIEPYESYEIKTGSETIKETGPAIILINID